MKYEEMVKIISMYLNSGDLKDDKWIEIMRVSRRLIEKEIESRNERRVREEESNGQIS